MRKDRYLKGQHNALCDYCSFKYKSSELRKDWKGLMACPEDYEQKHPQLTLKPRYDRQAVRDARPRQGEVTNADDPISPDNTDGLV